MKTKKEILEYLLSGSLKFATVSGVWTTKPNLIRRVDDEVPGIAMITTKSFQVKANPGNREPIVGEVAPGSYVNAVGLRNPGMHAGYRELKELRRAKPLRALLNVSVSANTPEDFITLVKKFADVADIIELNFSCPHAKPGYGASIGMNADLVKSYMEAIRPATDALLFPKLTPNVEDIGAIAKAAVDAGADGLAAINTAGPDPYAEPLSGELLLYNPNGHKGGRSGEHIFEIAVRKISEIRQAVGPDIPIIGMGGVSRGSQVRAMRRAGANVVGVGSAIARIKDEKYAEYFEALAFDTENQTDSAVARLTVKNLARYKAYTLTEATRLSETLMTLTLAGDPVLFKASQYMFIWIPGVGEKPFGIVSSSPLRFIVRKREYDKKSGKGEFTHALFEKKPGDTLYVRGVYGNEAPSNTMSNVLILSGGTGLALVPKLVEDLTLVGRIVSVFHGVITREEEAYRDLIEPYAQFTVVPDDGKPGRVLDAMAAKLDEIERENCTVYAVGPDILMRKALELAVEKGCPPEYCYASLETNTMCGIGMCGECECGGKISCKSGTFYAYPFLKEHYFNETDKS
ncbi:MAG: dihydroorotate dehydrogenase [Candidatus Marinimicrobia bacterium]|nr:dihydroorotate dehydrogenase [Candidatus Neomarinimicrobiota bacterium]